VKLLTPAVLCVAVLVGTGCQSQSKSRSQPRPRLELVGCGSVSVGKGWRVLATRNVQCAAARGLVETFFAAPRCVPAQRHSGTTCGVSEYRCRETARAEDVGLVQCTRSTAMVLAKSNS
jgi:hypothetical protein